MEKRLPTRAGSKKKVETQRGYRYVTPAVRLERKEISMLNPPLGLSQDPAPDPDTASTSDASARTAIVGKKGPLEEEGSSLMPRAPHNGQSPGQATEEPQKTAPSRERTPSAQEPTRTKKLEEEGEEPSPVTKEEAQVTEQKRTKETETKRTKTPSTKPEVIITTTAESDPSTEHDGIKGPSKSTPGLTIGRPTVQFADQPSRLKTAHLLEFFEDQASVGKDGALEVAEQSVRPETTDVMEFFQEQPVRQDSVRVSQQDARRETADVIEFFEENDPSLEEVSQQHPTLLIVPSAQQGSQQRGAQRSPSPSFLHASVGLSHLDNLIRLMEQLSSLKDENAKLRKKCDYLETTKNLLKARSELMSTSDSSSTSGYQSLPPARHKGHHHHHHHHRHHHRDGSGTRDAEGGRPRLFSAEDVPCLEISESASDSRPKRPKGAMHKRSFSTGSLEVEILDETSTADGRITKSKSGKSIFGAKSPKQKSKGSKWARVKKVLTGQFLYEDLGTTFKSLKEFGRSTQRYSTVSTEGQEFNASASRVPEQRSLDTSLETDPIGSRLPRVPSTSAEASSAGRSTDIPGSLESGDVEELGTEIWMGPPGWWEQYEAKKRQSEASNSSDVSSVIEVKTMYLGSGQKDTERLLKVKTLTRRQSSPSLSNKGTEGEEEEGEEEEEPHPVHRSSSYKDQELDISKDLGTTTTGSKSDSKKLHRKAWGRMKEIIHVRKDSVKKRARREKEAAEYSQGEEVSEVDMEGLMEEQASGEFGEGIISRSTPKTSPMVMPRQPAAGKSFSESPPQGTDPSSLFKAGVPPGGSEMAALIASSMSEEFARKMHDWEELQLRKSSFKLGSGEGEGEVAEGGGEAQEALTSPGADRPRLKGVSQSQPSIEIPVEGAAPPAEASPTELQAPSVNVEELQRRISESFSRKLAEWERRKYRRPTTPEMEQKGGRSRKKEEKEKDERTRSKKSREEKERERQEKAREREMQKVEKEQVKLEKEKVRLEKERQRAMERQAKLERMKGRLSQTDPELPSSPGPGSGSPPPGPPQDVAAQPKVTADFKKKLQEWEHIKTSLAVQDPGTCSSEGVTPSPQPSSFPPTFTLGPGQDPVPAQEIPPPLTLHPYFPDSPEERSPVDKASDASYGDDSTSVTDESYTKSNIASLERANSELLQEVQRKEQEYSTLQEEVNKLNNKLDKVRQEHAAEMARFRRELEAGTVTGPVLLEVAELESTVRELEEKIVVMENAGDQLAESMETAAIGKWQSMEGEEAVSQQLVDMVEQMKGMLVQAAHTRESPPPSAPSLAPLPSSPPPSATGEPSQKSLALHNFEHVYSHAMKLQVQMNNLRVSQLERNKEIMLIKRQLLLQEVNNVLLQAHITRRETELYQYRESRRQGPAVRRWNTFSGQGDNEVRPPLLRNISLQDSDLPVHPSVHHAIQPSPAPLAPSTTPNTKQNARHDDMSFVTDEDASIPEAGVAPRPDGVRPDIPSFLSRPVVSQETPADHFEQHHYVSSAAASTVTTINRLAAAIEQQQQQQQQQQLHQLSPHKDNLTMEESSATEWTTPVTSPQEQTPSASAVFANVQEPMTTTTTTATTTIMTSSASSVDSKVETGSPTLLSQTTARSLSTSPPLGERAEATTEIETPTQPIPERPDTGTTQSASSAMSASHRDETNFQTESVMECTELSVYSEANGQQAVKTSPEIPGSPSSSREKAVGVVDITSKGPIPKAVRSPVSRQKYLRRQKEERDKRKERAASPKSPQVSGDIGKPPLPKQSTPNQSPSTTHRSKSVGDMDNFQPSSVQTDPPLRDVIQKFEKRATVCETEERKLEFRKTPSPTLHLPRVGLVSRVRRLKPAAELLEESQRYRSGHSIYATRIMHRYLAGKAQQPGAASAAPPLSQDKENLSGSTYVQAIVKRLSRESTPAKSAGSSSGSSSLSLHRTDSCGRAHAEFVSHLVQKLSSSSGPVDHSSLKKTPPSSSVPLSSLPLKDVTNESQVKKLTRAFSVGEEEAALGPTRTVQPPSELDLAASDRTRAAEEYSTLRATSVTEEAVSPDETKPDSTISLISHVSMPSLASEQSSVPEDGARERAATYCVSEADRPCQFQQQEQQQLSAAGSGSQSIEHIAEEFFDPALLSIRERKGQKISPSSSTKSKNALCCQSSTCTKSKSSSSSSSPQTPGAHKSPSSPKGEERRAGRERMETIGVLCKQSMSFDLGVSLRAQSPEALPKRPQSAEPLGRPPGAEASGGEGTKARPSSTSSEGEAAACSEEKKKPRSRFLDSSWLQKPKKFFKVSK